MIGFKQLVGCCTPSTTTVNGPAFPGQGKMNFRGKGSVNFTLDASKFYATATANTLCDNYTVLLSDGTYGENLSASVDIDETSSALTVTDQGSYSIGIRWKYYSGNFAPTDKYITQDFNSSVLIFSKVQTGGGSHYSSVHCDDPFTSTAIQTRFYGVHDTAYLNGVSFNWLGVAQRDLSGIRLKVISGSYVWLVSVVGGVVSIYTDDGTKLFSTSGTLNQVATAINASSISTWIQARCSGWDSGIWTLGGGETNGDVASGYNEWQYVFTKNDASTILKNLGPTYINVSCNDTYAPAGWTTSTRLPVYVRNDILPPRGIVKMRIFDATDIGFNTLYADYPQLKFYDNTDAGALLFLTDPVYLTPYQQWGGDVDLGGPPVVVRVTTGLPVYTFAELWGASTYATLTRTNNGPTSFNKKITYSYTPLALQIYDEKFYGTINGCQSDNKSCPCYNPVYYDCYNQQVNSASPACVFAGCDYGGCPVYCFNSPCFYTSYSACLYPPVTPPASCVSSSDCIIKYSYYGPGASAATTPPTSGLFQASTLTYTRFI